MANADDNCWEKKNKQTNKQTKKQQQQQQKQAN